MHLLKTAFDILSCLEIVRCIPFGQGWGGRAASTFSIRLSSTMTGLLAFAGGALSEFIFILFAFLTTLRCVWQSGHCTSVGEFINMLMSSLKEFSQDGHVIVSSFGTFFIKIKPSSGYHRDRLFSLQEAQVTSLQLFSEDLCSNDMESIQYGQESFTDSFFDFNDERFGRILMPSILRET